MRRQDSFNYLFSDSDFSKSMSVKLSPAQRCVFCLFNLYGANNFSYSSGFLRMEYLEIGKSGPWYVCSTIKILSLNSCIFPIVAFNSSGFSMCNKTIDSKTKSKDFGGKSNSVSFPKSNCTLSMPSKFCLALSSITGDKSTPTTSFARFAISLVIRPTPTPNSNTFLLSINPCRNSNTSLRSSSVARLLSSNVCRADITLWTSGLWARVSQCFLTSSPAICSFSSRAFKSYVSFSPVAASKDCMRWLSIFWSGLFINLQSMKKFSSPKMRNLCLILRGRGFEPPSLCRHQHLKLACLPGFTTRAYYRLLIFRAFSIFILFLDKQTTSLL